MIQLQNKLSKTLREKSIKDYVVVQDPKYFCFSNKSGWGFIGRLFLYSKTSQGRELGIQCQTQGIVRGL